MLKCCQRYKGAKQCKMEVTREAALRPVWQRETETLKLRGRSDGRISVTSWDLLYCA